MQQPIKDEKLDYLMRGILTLSNMEECYRFFEDLCTVSELQSMARRLLAADLLRGNYTYADISEKTGLSTATISRVNHCLQYGDGGYHNVLDRLDMMKKH